MTACDVDLAAAVALRNLRAAGVIAPMLGWTAVFAMPNARVSMNEPTVRGGVLAFVREAWKTPTLFLRPVTWDDHAVTWMVDAPLGVVVPGLTDVEVPVDFTVDEAHALLWALMRRVAVLEGET